MQELIKQIIQIEDSAQEITRQAREEKKQLPQQLNEEIAAMRQRLEQEADSRLQSIENTEKEAAQRTLQEVHTRFQAVLHQIDQICEQRQEQWIQDIFQHIIR
ncbi:MAG: hypothetical protein ACOX7F_08840 [Eubacteriales bacterium]